MKGFSLIELLVVIAIIGIISAVSVPVYKDYRIKATISKNISLMQAYAADLKTNYHKSGFPSSVTISGVNIPSGSWQVVDDGDIYSASYERNNTIGYARIGFSLRGLEGIPNYVSPTTTSPVNNTYNAVFYQLYDNNDFIEVACGQLTAAASTQTIPLDFLPLGCKCTDTYYLHLNNGNCTP